ncbi:MAG TPA: MaoC family dehydratase N-terminal domain-containing protein [Dehalococcoidia bacterium]|jgi:acyl dehydratase|nr:MaoC family dehydratase N-terminal domain-containing protein [Dehalococcoidia bacterium]
MAQESREQTDPEWLITPEMRADIGVERPPMLYEVEKGPIRMYARAVGYTDRIFWDEDYAKSQGYRGLVAPPGFFGFRVITNPDDFTGGGAGIVSETSTGERLTGLNAGQRFVLTPGIVICAGDTLTATSKTVSIRQTNTRRGPAVITESERTYTNQNGEVVARNYGSAIRIYIGRSGEE